jgi:hypothetical protein
MAVIRLWQSLKWTVFLIKMDEFLKKTGGPGL